MFQLFVFLCFYFTLDEELNLDRGPCPLRFLNFARFTFRRLLLHIVPLLLETNPAQPQRRKEGRRRTGDDDVVRVPQPGEVRAEHGGGVLLHAHAAQDLADLVRARVDEDLRVHAGGVPPHALDQAVLEDGLRDGDEDGPAEGLEELHARRGDRDVLLREHVLDDQDAQLEAHADAEAREDLVAEPHAGRRVQAEGRDHTGPRCEEHHAGQHDGVVVADDGDERTAQDGRQHRGEEQGQQLDAGLDRAVALDTLEVQGQVVDEREEACAEQRREQHGAEHVSVSEEPRRQGPFVALPELDPNEQDKESTRPDEEADDA